MDAADLPPSWRTALCADLSSDWYLRLAKFVENERDQFQVYPSEHDVFNALRLTPLDQVRVFLLGQDPYHDEGQAHGLSFSVPSGIRLPPSLRNIFRELHTDLGIPPASHGCLDSWAKQGVLLLNAVLTVRAHEANSHRERGWEQLTAKILKCVNQRPHVAFVLWGSFAGKYSSLIDADRHLIIQNAHPSPLSARRGFFGSRPFSRINAFLENHGEQPIRWQLPDQPDISLVLPE